MKNIGAVFVILFLSIISFSCKKEYVCKCEIHASFDPHPINVDRGLITEKKKKSADGYCLLVRDTVLENPDFDSVVCYAYTYE